MFLRTTISTLDTAPDKAKISPAELLNQKKLSTFERENHPQTYICTFKKRTCARDQHDLREGLRFLRD